MTDESFADYDPQDGLTDGLIDKCPRCDESFHPDDYDGEIVRRDGTRHDHLTDTDPADRPFFCPGCYKALRAAENASQHRTLEVFDA